MTKLLFLLMILHFSPQPLPEPVPIVQIDLAAELVGSTLYEVFDMDGVQYKDVTHCMPGTDFCTRGGK